MIIFLFSLWDFSILFWLERKPQLYFLIFLNFLLFFWNFLLPVRSEGNGKTIFIFLFLGIFQPILAWNEPTMVCFYFFYFFFSFFGILYFPSSRNGTESQFLFSLFLLLLQPILAWKEAITGFFLFFFCNTFFFIYLLCVG